MRIGFGSSWPLLAFASLAACQGPSDEGGAPLVPDAGPPAAGEAPARAIVQVERGPLYGVESIRAPLRLALESLDGDVLETAELGAGPPDGVIKQLVEAPAPGRYRVRVYLDRDADAVFDGCPFPPSAEDTERADDYDNVFGVSEAVFGGRGGGPVRVRVERHICGPGDPATGLRGEVGPPEGEDLEGSPVILELVPLVDREMQVHSPQTADLDSAPDVRATLRIPLFPAGLATVRPFDIGELLPGRYRLTIFADADGDRLPSPCGSGVGGGDRHLVRLEPVEIVAGERRPLEPAIRLESLPDCPAELTGVRGRLDLSPGLRTLLDEGEPDPMADAGAVLAGEVRLALMQPTDGGTVLDGVRVLPALEARALPHPFTVSGLPPGTWRLVLYLDRDGDGRFGPCGGLDGGFDMVYAVRDGVTIRERRLSDLGAVALERAGDCDPEAAGLRGYLNVDVEAGAVGSGRPVRLELYPGDEGGERRSLVLFENHRTLRDLADEDGFAPFTATPGIPPGPYQARIYVDTDRDGTFASCLDAPFADRAATPLFPLTIEPGRLVDVGRHAVATLEGCPVPDVRVEPTIALAEGVAPGAFEPGALRLHLVEQGGFSDDRRLLGRVDGSELPYEADPVDEMAPGIWRLTAYVDRDGDGALTPCGEAEPDPVAGEVEIVLDEEMPHAAPVIPLDRACPRP